MEISIVESFMPTARRGASYSARRRALLLAVAALALSAAAQQSGDAYRQSVLAIQQQIDAVRDSVESVAQVDQSSGPIILATRRRIEGSSSFSPLSACTA